MITKETALGIQKLRDFYNLKPDAPIYQTEFGYYSLDRWISEGHMTDKTDKNALFGFDERGDSPVGGLGWCEAEFMPKFEEKWIADKGETHEIIQDTSGRHVLFFKGRRSGFMPEYVDHPVKDMKTWEQNVLWRLNPDMPERIAAATLRANNAKAAAAEGKWVGQMVVGAYMYLRSLIGPLELLYMFYDKPEVIHACMEAWFNLADATIARHQQIVEFDEIFFGEDICYNHGPLIAPEMIREFLFPYYQQLITNLKNRQPGRNGKLCVQIDTDGFSIPVIDLYKEIGMTYMSPFEVASGCDVVEVGKKWPDLLLRGGFDKRIMAESKEAIDREVDRIMPVMKKRGGYIPCCDHGVPEEVSFENYMHYRKRMLEFSK